ncbi:MAG: nucleotidyl transferase AbiEii/AbiGii toxin family protein [Planctomycetota bacterium]
MEQEIITQPQLGHLLELIGELGAVADNLVLVGGQAARLLNITARATKDFDFVLNVVALREITQPISDTLTKLGYQVVEKSKMFQFYKQISVTPDRQIRLEFLASDKEKRTKKGNIRIDIQKDLHARACAGAEIALKESDSIPISGTLPDGKTVQAQLRLIRSHALLMLKLFAMDERYRNIRGPKEYKHDREEAQIHTDDIVRIVRHHIQNPDFKGLFWSQFGKEQELEKRSRNIITEYFADLNAPGIQLYREFQQAQGAGSIDEAEVERALREIRLLL